MKAWMRDLRIVLTSSKLRQRLVFGNKEQVNLNIEVSGYKYLSSLKDNFSIRISNLTYSEILMLIDGAFYDVEIIAGYKSLGGGITIYKGSVLYISNELGDRKTNTVIILCTSSLIAKYGQQRLNFTLQSGINMYGALKFLCRKMGVQNVDLAEDLKYKFAGNGLTISQTLPSFVEQLTEQLNMSVNTDSSLGSNLTIWNSGAVSKREIKLTKDNIIFTGGYPRINSQGMRITVMPTFNFMPGDVIVIDNAFLDISAGSKEDVFKNNAMYLDQDGKYMVFEVSYTLQNRGSSFQIELLCRSRSLIAQSMLGGSK